MSNFLRLNNSVLFCYQFSCTPHTFSGVRLCTSVLFQFSHTPQIVEAKLMHMCVPFIPQTLIEANVDIKTTDGYLLRVFCIGFTKRQPNQIKKTSYAKTSQCRAIRRKMVETMTREISQIELKEVVNRL